MHHGPAMRAQRLPSSDLVCSICGAQVDMDEGQKLACLMREFPELSAEECSAALCAQAGNLHAAVAVLDMHLTEVRSAARKPHPRPGCCPGLWTAPCRCLRRPAPRQELASAAIKLSHPMHPSRFPLRRPTTKRSSWISRSPSGSRQRRSGRTRRPWPISRRPTSQWPWACRCRTVHPVSLLVTLHSELSRSPGSA